MTDTAPAAADAEPVIIAMDPVAKVLQAVSTKLHPFSSSGSRGSGSYKLKLSLLHVASPES